MYMLCVLVLWLGLSTAAEAALARGPARGLQSNDGRWKPGGTALALRAYDSASDAESTPTEAALQRTAMRCVGTTTLTRACHFENVYYDLKKRRFIYFGPEGSTSEQFGEPARPKEPWLRLVRGFTQWKRAEKQTQFFMDWRGGRPLPPARQVVTYRQPLHLRALLHTLSIGHLIRDNLVGLVDLPIRFGRDPADFDWVRWESKYGRAGWETESHTAEHYRGLLNNRPSVTWQEVLDKALEGAAPGVKYIQFAEIVGGQGPADLESHVGNAKAHTDAKDLLKYSHICRPAMFANMRDLAYRNHGIQVPSVADLEPFVLFLDGRTGEKRHLHNADDLIPKLQKTFPGVRMEHVVISAHPLEKQLDYLSKATVVVSNIGSRSFRLIYLPNGATAILVGPPEFSFKLAPKKEGGKWRTEKLPLPFMETISCWSYIGYVNILQYHVTQEEEVHRFKVWQTGRDARDTDSMLNERKLAALIRTALEQQGTTSAFQGAGSLAYVRSLDSAESHNDDR
eukprot:jgi/Ulvmu1/12325/UM089_0009.1